MGQELVVTEHKVLAETNIMKLLATKQQVERPKRVGAPISQIIAAKLMQIKERECTLPLSQNNSTKPIYTVMSSRQQCIGGEVDFSASKPHSLHQCVNGGDMVTSMVPPKAENVKTVSKEEKKAPQKKGQVNSRSKSGATLAEKLHGGRRDSSGKRRPSASIAWDSLNRSRESSPQHELAAIPFKWEEAPGKPKEGAHHHDVKTIAEAAERAMARRILQGVERSHRQEVLRQKRIAAQVVTESLSDHENKASSAKVKLQECRAPGDNSHHGSSLGSSHRFYARKTGAGLEQQSGSGFQGLRLSVDGDGHAISEMETEEAHIDLVAPAAAKFLVEGSTVSGPNGTTEQNPTTIPFKWEEAPGKPKFDDTADTIPKKLQLPPRLVAPLTQKPDSFMSQEMQDRHSLRSMSGPLLGSYYPLGLSNHTSSPAQTRPHQHFHPVMRSCSPSKRSISPSKIQALAKRLSRKVTDSLYEEQSWQAGGRWDPSSSPSKRSISPSKIQALLAKHLAFKVSSTGSAPNQGLDEDELFWQTRNPRNPSPSTRSLSPLQMQAVAMRLSHKVSAINNTVAHESSYEDQMWTARHPLRLERPLSSSKIQALATHLSCQVLNTAAPENKNPYDNPSSWQPRNLQHSCASGYHSGPLEGGEHNRSKGGGSGYGNFFFERSSLGAPSLRVNSEQDYNWAAGHKQASSRHHGAAWTLESSATSSKSSISPSMRSLSPSTRIHPSAKLLTKKVMMMPPQGDAAMEEDPNWLMQGKSPRHTFATCYDDHDSGPLERRRCTDQKSADGSSSSLERSWTSDIDLFGPPASSILQSSEIHSSSTEPAWPIDKKPQGLHHHHHHPWSPTSIFHGPNGSSSQLPTNSVPSSGSNIDTHTQATTTQPGSVDTLSKSLSHISYESFEHYFEEELHSPASSCHPPPQWDVISDNNISSGSSPYLGPTSAANLYAAAAAAQESGAGRATSDGVKAIIIKLCREGSKWRKSKKHQSPAEIWAPTLATYFQCVEQSATTSKSQLNKIRSCGPKHNKNEDMDSSSSLAESSPKAATRLPYTMPAPHVVEQETVGSELCNSSSSTHSFPSCLGLKLSPALFISRAAEKNRSHSSKGTFLWAAASRIPVSSASTNNYSELDGYRSPAYTATLELLSPSTKLISKKVLLGRNSQSIVTRGLPSSNIHKKIIDTMCKSLKRSIYNCARRCCHNTKLRLHEDHQLPSTGFSFSKPN